jgi:hypothetical protein
MACSAYPDLRLYRLLVLITRVTALSRLSCSRARAATTLSPSTVLSLSVATAATPAATAAAAAITAAAPRAGSVNVGSAQ